MFPSFPSEELHFIGLSQKTLSAYGVNPQKQIVPLWFGCKVQIEQLPKQCVIQVSGRSQFKLFINGESILFGPCRSTKSVAYLDTLDIAPQLKAGENRLVFQVFSYPENPSVREAQGPNYCYGDDAGPAICIKGVLAGLDLSDFHHWQAWLDVGMGFNAYGSFLLGANEVVDGEKALQNPFFLQDWPQSNLLPTQIVQPCAWDLFGQQVGKTFLPRPIPLLYRKEKLFSQWNTHTIPAHSKDCFVLDAGELTTAYFRIGFKNGKGTQVKITYAESYFQKDKNNKTYKAVRDDTSGFIDGVYDIYTVSRDTVYEPFRFRTFRFVQLTVITGEEPLTILPQPYIETAYPLRNTKKPVFTDPKKEKLYDVAFRTLQLCAHDTYEDCPYYEQLMYACDTRLEILFTYASTDDLALPQQAIRLFAASLLENGFTQARFPSRSLQIIPAFSLYFVLMLEDYVNYTGDDNFIRPYIPLAERIVENFLQKRNKNGLLASQGYWDYFDWTSEWASHGPDSTPTAARDGESALQNLFFVYACQSLCRLLPRYHRKDLARTYEEECQKLLKLVEKYCYVQSSGLYKEGPSTDEYSQHTQIYAVLTNLATGQKAKDLMEKVLTDKSLIQCSFVQKYYLFRALEKADMYDRTEPLWQAWQDFLDLHCTTFPETPFDPRSDCHGWSALPLSELQR